MKVCTDACLFGAWVADYLPKANTDTSSMRLLDIGTGTGLLSLMVAQKNNCVIDAIEIEDNAATQAAKNFTATPWSERLNLIHSDVIKFADGESEQKYDIIISNPPFYEGDLKSEDHHRNLALHSQALSLEALLDSVKHLLNHNGTFAVLLPYHRTAYFESLAAPTYNMYVQKKVVVKQTENHQPFRSMLVMRNEQQEVQQHTIIIKENGNYSEAFTALLKDYYLYL